MMQNVDRMPLCCIILLCIGNIFAFYEFAFTFFAND